MDRIVFANIVASAVPAWGEDLLPRAPVPPIRLFDVFMALFAFCSQLLLIAVAFPVLPNATRYAMGVLKRSVHSCYFCYHLRAAALEEEVAFFERDLGRSRILAELLKLRRTYRRSYSFVVGCLATVVHLQLRTALDNTFPREVVRAE